ncbi:hypothetical protein JL722_852 [Aureococcus anophagefferens]|nr:hypothetical protein JL722_852 [Aureococcus anophagefferens]
MMCRVLAMTVATAAALTNGTVFGLPYAARRGGSGVGTADGTEPNVTCDVDFDVDEDMYPSRASSDIFYDAFGEGGTHVEFGWSLYDALYDEVFNGTSGYGTLRDDFAFNGTSGYDTMPNPVDYESFNVTPGYFQTPPEDLIHVRGIIVGDDGDAVDGFLYAGGGGGDQGGPGGGGGGGGGPTAARLDGYLRVGASLYKIEDYAKLKSQEFYLPLPTYRKYIRDINEATWRSLKVDEGRGDEGDTLLPAAAPSAAAATSAAPSAATPKPKPKPKRRGWFFGRLRATKAKKKNVGAPNRVEDATGLEGEGDVDEGEGDVDEGERDAPRRQLRRFSGASGACSVCLGDDSPIWSGPLDEREILMLLVFVANGLVYGSSANFALDRKKIKCNSDIDVHVYGRPLDKAAASVQRVFKDAGLDVRTKYYNSTLYTLVVKIGGRDFEVGVAHEPAFRHELSRWLDGDCAGRMGFFGNWKTMMENLVMSEVADECDRSGAPVRLVPRWFDEDDVVDAVLVHEDDFEAATIVSRVPAIGFDGAALGVQFKRSGAHGDAYDGGTERNPFERAVEFAFGDAVFDARVGSDASSESATERDALRDAFGPPDARAVLATERDALRDTFGPPNARAVLVTVALRDGEVVATQTGVANDGDSEVNVADAAQVDDYTLDVVCEDAPEVGLSADFEPTPVPSFVSCDPDGNSQARFPVRVTYENNKLWSEYVTFATFVSTPSRNFTNERLLFSCERDDDGQCQYPPTRYACVSAACFTYVFHSKKPKDTSGLTQRIWFLDGTGSDVFKLGKGRTTYYDFCIDEDGGFSPDDFGDEEAEAFESATEAALDDGASSVSVTGVTSAARRRLDEGESTYISFTIDSERYFVELAPSLQLSLEDGSWAAHLLNHSASFANVTIDEDSLPRRRAAPRRRRPRARAVRAAHAPPVARADAAAHIRDAAPHGSTAPRARCDCYDYANASAVPAEAPDPPLVPAAVVSGPTTASACEGLTLESSQSSGGGGRPMTYSWAVAAVPNASYWVPGNGSNVSLALSALDAMAARGGDALAATSAELVALASVGVTSLEATLGLENFLGGAATSAPFTVALRSDTPPNVVVVGGVARSLANRATPLAVNVDAIATSCDGRAAADRDVAYVWTAYDAAGGALDLASTSRDPRAFKLGAYALQAAAAYTVAVVVTDVALGLNVTAAVAVDGFSGEAAGLRFAWACEGPACPAGDVLAAETSEALGLAGLSQVGRATFAVNATADGRSSTASVALELVDDDPPFAAIDASEVPSRVPSAAKVVLYGAVAPSSLGAAADPALGLNSTWRLTGGALEDALPLEAWANTATTIAFNAVAYAHDLVLAGSLVAARPTSSRSPPPATQGRPGRGERALRRRRAPAAGRISASPAPASP